MATVEIKCYRRIFVISYTDEIRENHHSTCRTLSKNTLAQTKQEAEMISPCNMMKRTIKQHSNTIRKSAGEKKTRKRDGQKIV